MKAHLIKAAWDGGNDPERITQWIKEKQEEEWAEKVESDIEVYYIVQKCS